MIKVKLTKIGVPEGPVRNMSASNEEDYEQHRKNYYLKSPFEGFEREGVIGDWPKEKEPLDVWSFDMMRRLTTSTIQKITKIDAGYMEFETYNSIYSIREIK